MGALNSLSTFTAAATAAFALSMTTAGCTPDKKNGRPPIILDDPHTPSNTIHEISVDLRERFMVRAELELLTDRHSQDFLVVTAVNRGSDLTQAYFGRNKIPDGVDAASVSLSHKQVLDKILETGDKVSIAILSHEGTQLAALSTTVTESLKVPEVPEVPEMQ